VPLLESVPNFSEGRDPAVIERLAAAAARSGAHVLDRSFDADHHRVVLTLAGTDLLEGVFASVAAAVENIDLRAHAGVHPRRGAADVVPIVPIGSDSLAEAALMARALGERIWSELRVPVHFYGAAGGSTLAQIRSANPPPPDLGDRPHPTAGVVSVGAREPLVAYNLLLAGVAAAEAAGVAGRLRESAGGARGVQALVFAVAGGTQLSMNLFRLRETGPAVAREEARRRLPAGGSIVGEEIVGLCPVWAADGCAAADGLLLEARLAAAAARLAAGTCASQARLGRSEEMLALAARLEAESASLGRLGFEDALAGGERAAALRPVLRAAGIVNEELDAMLLAAAAGFREALGAETLRRSPERVAALDRRVLES
jgi:glutamate formiminotransferase / 5-formyltetrahydrofolate cyclo-ligase